MSETHIWHFSFSGRGLPRETAALLTRLRGGSGKVESGIVSEAVAPGAPEWMRGFLYEIFSLAAPGGVMGFSPWPNGDRFSWDFTGALHDDLAVQSFTPFFAWLCQYAAKDHFFGMESVLGAPRPTFLYGIGGKLATLDFEKAPGGALAGPYGVAAVSEALKALDRPPMPLADAPLPIPAHMAQARWFGWKEVCAVMGGA